MSWNTELQRKSEKMSLVVGICAAHLHLLIWTIWNCNFYQQQHIPGTGNGHLNLKKFWDLCITHSW
jgi:hypothetical protein